MDVPARRLDVPVPKVRGSKLRGRLGGTAQAFDYPGRNEAVREVARAVAQSRNVEAEGPVRESYDLAVFGEVVFELRVCHHAPLLWCRGETESPPTVAELLLTQPVVEGRI